MEKEDLMEAGHAKGIMDALQTVITAVEEELEYSTYQKAKGQPGPVCSSCRELLDIPQDERRIRECPTCALRRAFQKFKDASGTSFDSYVDLRERMLELERRNARLSEEQATYRKRLEQRERNISFKQIAEGEEVHGDQVRKILIGVDKDGQLWKQKLIWARSAPTTNGSYYVTGFEWEKIPMPGEEKVDGEGK